jgi:hypothetical protein
MKIVREETLLSCGKYASSGEWKQTRLKAFSLAAFSLCRRVNCLVGRVDDPCGGCHFDFPLSAIHALAAVP